MSLGRWEEAHQVLIPPLRYEGLFCLEQNHSLEFLGVALAHRDAGSPNEDFLDHSLACEPHGMGRVPSVPKGGAFPHALYMLTCISISSSQRPHGVDTLAAPIAQMGTGGSEKSAGWLRTTPLVGGGAGLRPRGVVCRVSALRRGPTHRDSACKLNSVIFSEAFLEMTKEAVSWKERTAGPGSVFYKLCELQTASLSLGWGQ